MKTVQFLAADINIANTYWKGVVESLGMTVVYSNGDYVLPLTDSTCKLTSEYFPDKFMSAYSFHSLTDRIEQADTGLPIIPTIIPSHKEQLSIFGTDIPLFIKHARTYDKPETKWAYKEYKNSIELESTLTQDFYDHQNNPGSNGPYIIQPSIGFPHTNIAICFSVNENSKPYFCNTMSMVYHDYEEFHECISPVETPSGIKDIIISVCNRMQIRGGIHEVEFIQYNNQWCVMDWNARPYVGTSLGIFSHADIMEAALSHMVGLPPKEPKPFYAEQRWYADKNLSLDYLPLISSFGLFPRTHNKIVRLVCGDGPTKEDVTSRFDSLTKALSV